MIKSYKIGILIVGFIFLIGIASASIKFPNIMEKNPVISGPYTVITDSDNGKLMFKSMPKPMFVFNAHGLNAKTSYSLISLRESSGTSVKILGDCNTDKNGNCHIMKKINMNSDLVCNQYPTPIHDEYAITGSRILLVLSSDIRGTTLQNPAKVLFESNLININCQLA